MSNEYTDRMTVYVDAEHAQRGIKYLELEYNVAYNANKGDIHQAIFNVAFDHEEAVIEELRRLTVGDDE